MKAIRSRLVKLALALTTGTMMQVDICPNVWGQLTGQA